MAELYISREIPLDITSLSPQHQRCSNYFHSDDRWHVVVSTVTFRIINMISSIKFRQKYYAKSDMNLREAILFFYLFEHYINCKTKFKNRSISKKAYFELNLLRILTDLDAVYKTHDDLSSDIKSLWSQDEIKLIRQDDKLYFRFKVKK